MKIGKIGISYNSGAAPLQFSMASDVSTAAYVLKGVDGLDPPDVNLIMGEALNEGVVYANGIPQAREVTILIGLQPNYALGESAGDLRDILYRILTPWYGGSCRLHIYNPAGTTQILEVDGYVKKVSAAIWSKDPAVQIVFSCKGPYLLDSNFTVPTPASLGKSPITIPYPGNAPGGFYIQIQLTTSMGFFYIEEVGGGSSRRLRVDYGFMANDVIRFNTSYGSRFLEVVRSGVTTNLLGYKSVTSIWPQLRNGNNGFYPANANFNITAIFYQPRYWGI